MPEPVTVEVLEKTVRIVPEAFQSPPPTRSAAVTPANLREIANPRPPAGSSALGFPISQTARNFGRAAGSAAGRIYQTAPYVAGQVARVGWGVAKGIGKGIVIGIINDAALGVADAFVDNLRDVDSRSRNFEKPIYDPSARPNNAPYNWGYERGREIAEERTAARQELQELTQEQWDSFSETGRDVAQDLIDRGKDWAREIPWPEIGWPEINIPPINFPEINWPDGQLIDKPAPIQFPTPSAPDPAPDPVTEPNPFGDFDWENGEELDDFTLEDLEELPKPEIPEENPDGPTISQEDEDKPPELACEGWGLLEYALNINFNTLFFYPDQPSRKPFFSKSNRQVLHKRWVFRPYNKPEKFRRTYYNTDSTGGISETLRTARILKVAALDCGFDEFLIDAIYGGWDEEQWRQRLEAFPSPRPCGNSASSLLLPGFQNPPFQDQYVFVGGFENYSKYLYSYLKVKQEGLPYYTIRVSYSSAQLDYFRITCHTSGGGGYWGPNRVEPRNTNIIMREKMGCNCDSIRAMFLSLKRTLKIPVISCELNEETNLWEAKSEEKEIEIFTLDEKTAAGMGEIYRQQAEMAIAQCEAKNSSDIKTALGFPVTVPKYLNSGQEEEEEITNLVELYRNWIGIFDGLMGEFPVKMQVTTDEGQEHEIELLSVADALGDLTALAVPTFYDADNCYTLQIKGLIEQAKSFSLLNQAFHLLFSISEQLGFNIEKIPSTLELPFNPNYPDDWEQFNQDWIPEEPNSYIYQNIDKQTLKGILIDLGELLAPVHGSVAERASPMAIAEKARKLAEILRVGRELGLGEVLADVLNQNWDGVLDKLSQQATPTTPEIKVRKKNEPNQ